MPTMGFSRSLPFVLRWEGGFVNNPADPGGATNKGVTQAVYDAWRKRRALPERPVREIDDDEVATIYEGDYWMPPRCDVLGRGLDLVQFDTAVNMGVGRAVRMLQATLACGVDGDFGGETLRAVEQCDLGGAVAGYCDRREAYYRGLVAKKPALGIFLKGWLNRLNALRHEAGLPGFESVERVDFGDTDHLERIPDDPAFD